MLPLKPDIDQNTEVDFCSYNSEIGMADLKQIIKSYKKKLGSPKHNTVIFISEYASNTELKTYYKDLDFIPNISIIPIKSFGKVLEALNEIYSTLEKANKTADNVSTMKQIKDMCSCITYIQNTLEKLQNVKLEAHADNKICQSTLERIIDENYINKVN